MYPLSEVVRNLSYNAALCSNCGDASMMTDKLILLLLALLTSTLFAQDELNNDAERYADERASLQRRVDAQRERTEEERAQAQACGELEAQALFECLQEVIDPATQ